MFTCVRHGCIGLPPPKWVCPTFKNLVDEKLATACEFYGFMIEQFHHGRAFVLELIVVIILVIELVFLFRGK